MYLSCTKDLRKKLLQFYNVAGVSFLSKYRRGVCPECKVKEGDSRKKTLYQCNLCERWFCAKHFEPKLVRIPDYKSFVKYPEARVIFEKERREDGHPDFAYSLKRIKELDMEEKLYSKLIEDALNRSKAYRKKTPKKGCPKCGSTIPPAVLAFDKKNESLQCRTCGYSWKQPRKLEISDTQIQSNKTRPEIETIKPEEKRPAKYVEARWKERPKPIIPMRKVCCAITMIGVAFAYVPGLEWALALNIGEGIISYLPWAFVLAMCHELLHASAWWYYGYSAIPIPILIPPILGITIGEKPRNRWENFTISLAPILLTIVSLLVYHMMGNEQYLWFGMINLVGMVYDIVSAFIR